jgi:flagellar protein FlgJ
MDIAPLSIYQSIQNMASDQQKLKAACTEFEAILISQLLKGLRATVQKSGLIDGGLSEEIFTDMLYTQYAKNMAEKSGFGLSDMLYEYVSRRL